MKILIGQDRSLLQAIFALIGRSPIAVAKVKANLPEGYGEVDGAILDWIANDVRHFGGSYARH
ncbi:MAG TPA: hypothetical protein VGG11_09275 [Xanthobacteraceae bacterium]|jgi:hypothetical protein